MLTLLHQLNTVPGVTGSLVSDLDGEILAQASTQALRAPSLAGAAKTLAASVAGLARIAGPVRMLDLRYANTRVVVRPVSGANLLFLCAPSMNLQPLDISASVAAAKLEKLVADRAARGGATSEAGASSAARAGQLHAVLQRINAIIERKRLDPFSARGEIAIQAGFGLGFIDPETPDDPEKLSKLKAAATAVLGEPV